MTSVKAVQVSEKAVRALSSLQAEKDRRARLRDDSEAGRKSFRKFIGMAWDTVEPSRPLVPNWHIDAIADHLQAVKMGHIQQLAIAMPPGHLKSVECSVLWPAWYWLDDPFYRGIFASYSGELATRDSVRCRELISSDFYRGVFEPDWALSKTAEDYFINTRKGSRFSTSVDASGTGFRGDLVVVDDPLKAGNSRSPAALERAIFWWDQEMSSRFNDKTKGAKVIVMQRLAENDLIGHCIKRGGYTYLRLPTEFEPSDRTITLIGPGKMWQDPRTLAGELLFPAMFPRETVDKIKYEELGSFGFTCQHQQRVTPATGGILKTFYWRYWQPKGVKLKPVPVKLEDGSTEMREAVELPVRFDEIVQSWDCLDSEAEILTRDGWRGRGQVGIGDLVYSLNLETDKLELVPVEDYGERLTRPGESFVSIDGCRAHVRVTEGHSVYAGLVSGKDKSVEIKLLTADELAKRNRTYRLRTSAECEFPGVPLSDDELRFIAWFITDGGFSNQYVAISQTKDYKDDIRSLLRRLGLDFIEKSFIPKHCFKTEKPVTVFKIPKGTKTLSMARKGWSPLSFWLEKRVNPALMLMTERQFKVFWAELMKGDGDLSNGYLCTAIKEMAERLQAMAVVRGLSSSMHSRPSKAGREMFYVSVRSGQWIQSNPKIKTAARLKKELPGSPEIVWCVQNCNSTLVTRRRGKVVILGNCTFKDTKSSDYVVGLIAAAAQSNRYVLDLERERMDFAKTCHAIRKMSMRHPNAVTKLVEDKANGPAIISSLKQEIGGFIPVEPIGNKLSRASACLPLLESGNWYLPHPDLAPWVPGFISELGAFNAGGVNDDQVDAWSQAGNRLRKHVGKVKKPIQSMPYNYAASSGGGRSWMV